MRHLFLLFIPFSWCNNFNLFVISTIARKVFTEREQKKRTNLRDGERNISHGAALRQLGSFSASLIIHGDYFLKRLYLVFDFLVQFQRKIFLGVETSWLAMMMQDFSEPVNDFTCNSNRSNSFIKMKWSLCVYTFSIVALSDSNESIPLQSIRLFSFHWAATLKTKKDEN